MKIRELIEKLKQFDEDREIVIAYDSECPLCSEPLSADYDIIELKQIAVNTIGVFL